ncbi:pyridoxamine 5'-phosphate oxidase family protein [Aurantiacibacter sp. MUD61]|uniref:pyridoxamine 5'-phosphate oxidase family protein n=1 Tax=Aurantiacibacter sp. MUD61 TaxID=3009083 RepID=UPI0022F0F5BD|nr:pyridoxamine 5'-phosphate oxidase family protein [Aurantiacibacter sp. MUD61]
MADFTETLTEKHIAMIERQPVFFVATAAPDARINLSPKGYDAFRVLAPDRVAWLDLAGSGNETNAHLLADGRITIMLCNFERPALILRIYGRGKPVLPADDGWNELSQHFTLFPGTRQIFDIAVESVQTSCGWGVPFMEYERERYTLLKAHSNVDEEKWVGKRQAHPGSIDGLPTSKTDRYIEGTMPAPEK